MPYTDDPHDALSRLINMATGGDPEEMFSSRTYRERWDHPVNVLVWIAVDAYFFKLRREWAHCRKACARERQERAEMPDRCRAAGL